MEKYGFVYIWYDRKHKRYYIGSHWGTVDDGYICSSTWMRNSYKRRPEDFKRRIIETNLKSTENTFNREGYWLSFIKQHELGKKYYNYINRAIKQNGNISEETKRKIGKANSISQLGKHHQEKTKKKISENNIGKHSKIFTEEHKRNLSKHNARAFLGKHHSDESKIKISKSKLGKKFTEEHKKNLSKNHWKKKLKIEE